MAEYRSTGEYVASSMCFSALIFAAWYAGQGRWVDVAVLLLVGLGQVLAFLSLRGGYARAACSLVLLVAGVSAAELIYERVWWWDLLIHFACTYALVWIVWNLALRRAPRRGKLSVTARVLVCAAAGLTLALVWELMELLGFLLVDPEIYIPPLDTLGDIAVGVAGASLVGLRTTAS